MQTPIKDRTPRLVDLPTVARTFHDEGYEQTIIGELARAGRDTPYEEVVAGLAVNGLTHVAKTPNDHSWRLVTAGGKWYFYYTDYSPRIEEPR